MQRSSAVFLWVGPVPIHGRIGMQERQPRYKTGGTVRPGEAHQRFDRNPRRVRIRQGNDLHMFMRLAGSGNRAGVIKGQSVDFRERDQERLAILLRQLRLLSSKERVTIRK